MTAKEYLQNAYKIERRVKIIENKVKKLRSQLEYAGISYENTGAICEVIGTVHDNPELLKAGEMP